MIKKNQKKLQRVLSNSVHAIDLIYYLFLNQKLSIKKAFIIKEIIRGV